MTTLPPTTIAIIGASGYSGAELMRLLAPRRDVRITQAIARTTAGERVDTIYPFLAGQIDLRFEALDLARLDGTDVVFVALPSGEAMTIIPELRSRVGRVIDLGGDFRLPSASMYEQYYRKPHTAASLLGTAIYGLPELNKARIESSTFVANPGCYPTSAILGLLPALSNGIVEPGGIAINSLSGVSGAGRSSSVEYSFTELHDNIRAYKIGNHQHIPEIQSVLAGASGQSVTISFVPHLIPTARGIYTTIQADLKTALPVEDILALYQHFYADAPFVRVKHVIPQMASVLHTNYCDIGLFVEPHTNKLIVISTIDNLVKGAAGQAIQNMNLMLGFPEATSL